MENVYYQHFSGETSYACGVPCEAAELVHFRNRIGQQGVESILKQSIRVNGDDADDAHVSVDATAQQKNITFPTDDKLYKKIIKKCWSIAQAEGLPMRQSYRRPLKKLSVNQRFRNHPKNQAKARKAGPRVKTIAGRLVREVERNLPGQSKYQNDMALFKKVLLQKRNDFNVMRSAAAFNFERMMNKRKSALLSFLQNFAFVIYWLLYSPINHKKTKMSF
jgi:IS5 family transposase